MRRTRAYGQRSLTSGVRYLLTTRTGRIRPRSGRVRRCVAGPSGAAALPRTLRHRGMIRPCRADRAYPGRPRARPQPRYRPGSRSAAKSNVSATRNAWLRHPCGVNELPFYKWSSAVRSTWIRRLDSGVPGSRSGLHADTTSGLYYQYHKVNNRPVRSPRYPLFFSDLLR